MKFKKAILCDRNHQFDKPKPNFKRHILRLKINIEVMKK